MKKVVCIAFLTAICLAMSLAAQANLFGYPGFEGASIGTSNPGNPNQSWWVNGTGGDQYATWSIDPTGGIDGSACAKALPGPNAIGGGSGSVVALRQYYLPNVMPNTMYTISFWYKAIGDGFQGIAGQNGTYDCSELQVQVLEAPNADCSGGWQWPSAVNVGTAASEWTRVQYTFTSLETTHGFGLKFGILMGIDNRTSPTDVFYLDNVSMTAVPEPGTIASLLSGVAGMGLMVIRRRRA